MKRFLALFLVAALLCTTAIAFAGCGEKEDSSAASDKATADSATGDSASGDSANTGSKGELHMATNAAFEPYEYKEGDKIIGIDAEIAQAICDKLGYTLVIDDMEFDAIITAVSTGKADFGMAGMTVTDERKKSVDFTDPYTNAIQAIIVNDGESTVKTKADLAGKAIGVQLGTTGDIYVSDPENVKDAKVERFSKGADAVLALTQKKVDAVVIDNEPAKKFVAQNPGTKILDEPFENEEYAICLKQGSDLTEEFNKALKELKDDGTVQKIIDKYIKAS